jgi:hypothetical protein
VEGTREAQRTLWSKLLLLKFCERAKRKGNEINEHEGASVERMEKAARTLLSKSCGDAGETDEQLWNGQERQAPHLGIDGIKVLQMMENQ